jgi:hypothetical protein
MKTIFKTLTIISVILIGSFFQSCSDWNTFYEGKFEGENYKLQTRSKSGYFSVSNSIDYRIKLGSLPYIPMDVITTNWDVVYSTDIFGSATYHYITNKDIQYSNNNTEAIGGRSFLYLNPDDFSEKEYKKYLNFFKSNEWKKADSINVDKTETRYPFPHIVGLVYSESSKFTKIFKGKYQGKEHELCIENDGRIRLMDTEFSGEIGTGLSQKVQMPDKIIYVPSPTPGSLTIEDVKKFKNKTGESPLKYFKFLEKK